LQADSYTERLPFWIAFARMTIARQFHDLSARSEEADVRDAREAARLAALHRLNLLDKPASKTCDQVTRLTAAALNVPIVLVSLVDEKRQWFKSRVGLDATETPRAISFCAHAVTDRTPLIVPDATLDVRFAANPMVTGAPHVRAYAGIPLYTSEGHAIGALCAIDRQPRQFTPADMSTLRDAARAIEECLRVEEASIAPAPEDLTAGRLVALDADALRDGLQPDVEQQIRDSRDIIEALRGHLRRRPAFEESSRRQEVTVRALPGAPMAYVSYWNSRLRCEFVNAAHCARFQCALDQAIGMSMQDLLGPAFADIESSVRLALDGREQRVGRPIPLPGGKDVAGLHCIPDRSDAAQVQGLFLIFISQRTVRPV